MDIQLFYREAGHGTPLVLLHGNGENGSYFTHQFQHFSRSYRVIAPDTRGHGQSPRGSAPFTIAQFAHDLKNFLDAMVLERVILLGFSDGANIAMRFALAYPERLQALILNGGNLDASGVKRSYQLPIELGYRVARRFAKKSERARQNAELLGLMVNEPNIRPDELSAISVPTLVIAGKRDMIREEHTRLIARSIPNAQLVLLPGSHFLAAKRPDRFNQAVEQFLSRKTCQNRENMI